MSGDPLPPALESQILRILDGPDAERDGALEALCDANPEARDAIRRYAVDVSAEGDPGHRDGAIDYLPERIGPYRILEILGEGGMGIVYLAEQRTPLERRVALKVIRLGLDTKQVLARFEAERSALSRMEHPCIARVLDAGRTESGQPFFAMEVVRGVPLTDYCDRYRLDTRRRLELFVRICEAVQHAHSKGIVHRDLKPSNILVTDQDGKPVPKIIDFGLARATDQRLTEQTYFTAHGVIVGTPAYMSPEQADGSGLDVDTRTDVYSLGVLLYEMLSGHLPFDPRELQEAGFVELQRRIRDEEPPKPSTRVAAIEDEGLATKRKLGNTAHLVSQLRGDLDWITLKALEKERVRRYATAAQFAEDVRRHLDFEPVLASPPGALYRLRKFVRKRRGLVAAIVVSFVLILAALVFAIAQADIAIRALGDREAALSSYRRMKDAVTATRLVEAHEDELWPAFPGKVAAMDEWQRRARELLARLEDHKATLERIRERARAPSTAVVALREKIARLRLDRQEGLPLELRPVIALRLQSLAAELARLRWRFESPEDQLLHDTFSKLVAALEKIESELVPSLYARRRRAATLVERSIPKNDDLWRAAVAAIASNDRYRRMSPVKPQLGLRPLGMDPDSKLHEFAVVDTGTIPTRRDGRLELEAESAIVLVLLPPGTIHMGVEGDPGNSHGQDPNPTSLDAFFISKYEMTQAQWQRCFGENPSRYPVGAQFAGRTISPRNPVENIDWTTCDKAMARLGLQLPSEAQWEYAARAGTLTRWWSGDELESLRGVANVSDLYSKTHAFDPLCPYEESIDDGHAVHAPVGSFGPNAFGLHDVIGNVWEWCRDEYIEYGKGLRRSGDGLREHPHARLTRLCRGGSFSELPTHCHSADRNPIDVAIPNPALGVRPARPLIR